MIILFIAVVQCNLVTHTSGSPNPIQVNSPIKYQLNTSTTAYSGNNYKYSDQYANISFYFYNSTYNQQVVHQPPASIINGVVHINATDPDYGVFDYNMNIDSNYDNISYTSFDVYANGSIIRGTVIDHPYGYYGEDLPVGFSHLEWIIYTNTSVTISVAIDFEVGITDFTAPTITVDILYQVNKLPQNASIDVKPNTQSIDIEFHLQVRDSQAPINDYWIEVNGSAVVNEVVNNIPVPMLRITPHGHLTLGIGNNFIDFYAEDIFGNMNVLHLLIDIYVVEPTILSSLTPTSENTTNIGFPAIRLNYPVSVLTSLLPLVYLTNFRIKKVRK